MAYKYTHLTNFEGKLYRYQPYSEGYEKYVNDIIIDNKVFYSSHLSFNDPFDCKLYGIKFSNESVEQFLRERIKNQVRFADMVLPPEIRRPSPEQVDALLDKAFNRNRVELMAKCAQTIQDLHKIVENEIGVLCLTNDPLNILMYSHYADRHRGVCLEFSLPKGNILNPEMVRYVKDFPRLDFGLSHEVNYQLAVALISTKSLEWTYENEYRSLRGGGAGVVEIPDGYLTGIIFGCAAKDETIQAVMDVVSESRKNIKLYRAVKSQTSFSLSLKEM